MKKWKDYLRSINLSLYLEIKITKIVLKENVKKFFI